MNVVFDIKSDNKVARRIEWIQNGQQGGVDLAEDELVFVTNGSLVENSEWSDHHTPAKFDPIVHDGGSWHLWRNIAAQAVPFSSIRCERRSRPLSISRACPRKPRNVS
jgi:oleate hydratase